jgi:hypothetical protein
MHPATTAKRTWWTITGRSVLDDGDPAAMSSGGLPPIAAGWLPPAVVIETMDILWPEDR